MAYRLQSVRPPMHKIGLLFLAALSLCGLVSNLPATPPPVRLFQISVARFTERSAGEVWLERGLLSADTSFYRTDESPVLSTVTVPAEALNKWLITSEAWYAYDRLGAEAVANFQIDENATPFLIGLRNYFPVTVREDAKLSVGKLVNISSRARVTPDEPMIAGFVVTEQHRQVLIRAVGPTLGAMGVGSPLANPYLTLFKGKLTYYYNDDWGNRYNAADIAAAAAKVGAFALPAGSKDAALLIELQPGVYTAHVTSETNEGGTALVEVYSVD